MQHGCCYKIGFWVNQKPLKLTINNSNSLTVLMLFDSILPTQLLSQN